MKKNVILVLGAKSDIGRAIAHRFGQEGYDIYLAGRDAKTLAADQTDLTLRYGVAVSIFEFDALALSTHENFVSDLPQLPTIAVSTIGAMGDQAKSQLSGTNAALVMRSNYEGPASILAVLASHFESRGFGTLIGVSSVAGERGRASNYVYGSAKAGLTAFLSGLRNRFASTSVHVITVLPGFVDTKMTEDLDLPAGLTAMPSEVADRIFFAVKHQRNVVYVKPIWWAIMMAIKLLPEFLFKRTRL